MVDFSRFASDKLQTLSGQNWDAFVSAVAAELTALEARADAQSQVAQQVLLRGLQQIDDFLTPVITDGTNAINGAVSQVTGAVAQIVQAVDDVGLLLQATSSSPVTIGLGNKTFIVDPSARAAFIPTLFIAAQVTSDPNSWVAGTTISYDKASGTLVMNVSATRGAGTYSSWVLGISMVPQIANLEGIASATLATDFSSFFNGSATSFGLTDVSLTPIFPGSASLCDVYLNGLALRPGTDFTISGSNIVFTVAPPSGAHCIVKVWAVTTASGVNADWNASSGPAQILNKPTIPAAQVPSDWNATSPSVARILNKPVLGTAAAFDAPASGNASASQLVKGDDTRLTGARTPTAHASTHASGGSDPVSIDSSQVSGLAAVAHTGSYADLTAKPGNFIGDSGTGGAQGFVPAPSAGDAGAGKFLSADGSWAVPSGGVVMVGCDASTDGAAGLVPKPLAGDQMLFLRGDGTWADPGASGGGGGSTNLTATPDAVKIALASSTGTGCNLTAATASLAGVMTAADRVTLNGLGTASSKNVPASGDAASGEVVLGSDSRLTNSRTPTAHASSHAAGGSDALSLSADQISDGTANKVYTAAEKTKLAGIASGATVQVNSDWNATSGIAQILNKPALAAVATSGSAADLSGTLPRAAIPNFDSTHNGGVPASGGGTANFLRADGSWAAPQVTGTVASDISGSFNGSAATFALTDSGANPISPRSAALCMVVLGGVPQKPGTDFTISGSNITFSTAPASGISCFIVVLS